LPAQTIIAQADADADTLFQQGSDKITAGDYQGAVEAFTQLLELNPKDAEAYYNRGLALAQLEQYEKAIADYTEVLQRKPDDAEAYYNRGLSHAQLEGSEEEAIQDLQKAAELFTKAGQTAESQEALSIVKNLQQ
jgi:tetratricopeptide (TPR) repeat protein